MYSLNPHVVQKWDLLTTNLSKWMTEKFLVTAAICLLLNAGSAYGQVKRAAEVAKRPAEPTSRLQIPPGEVGACGYSPTLSYQMNQQAHRRNRVSPNRG